MRDILGWTTKSKNAPPQTGYKNKTGPGSMVNVGDEQLRMRICRADFHGAFVKVTKSRSAQHLGIQVQIIAQPFGKFQDPPPILPQIISR